MPGAACLAWLHPCAQCNRRSARGAVASRLSYYLSFITKNRNIYWTLHEEAGILVASGGHSNCSRHDHPRRQRDVSSHDAPVAGADFPGAIRGHWADFQVVASQAGRAVFRRACVLATRDVSARRSTSRRGCSPLRRWCLGSGLFSTTTGLMGQALCLPLHCFYLPRLSRIPRPTYRSADGERRRIRRRS